MDDLISRQAVVNVICDMHIGGKDGVANALPNTYGADIREIIEQIDSLPSADVPHWIPCSEQMPPMDEYVLVCTVDGDITDGQRWDEDDDGTWFIFGDSHSASDGDIVAWMPLPEPYEEGETNE